MAALMLTVESETKPRIMYVCYFNLDVYEGVELSDELRPENMFLTTGLDSSIDPDKSVSAVSSRLQCH